MYMNAYDFDYKPISCKLLATLFLFSNSYEFKNAQLAKYYLDEAIKLKIFKDKVVEDSIK
jgi:hypothetical protein